MSRFYASLTVPAVALITEKYAAQYPSSSFVTLYRLNRQGSFDATRALQSFAYAASSPSSSSSIGQAEPFFEESVSVKHTTKPSPDIIPQSNTKPSELLCNEKDTAERSDSVLHSCKEQPEIIDGTSGPLSQESVYTESVPAMGRKDEAEKIQQTPSQPPNLVSAQEIVEECLSEDVVPPDSVATTNNLIETKAFGSGIQPDEAPMSNEPGADEIKLSTPLESPSSGHFFEASNGIDSHSIVGSESKSSSAIEFETLSESNNEQSNVIDDQQRNSGLETAGKPDPIHDELREERRVSEPNLQLEVVVNESSNLVTVGLGGVMKSTETISESNVHRSTTTHESIKERADSVGSRRQHNSGVRTALTVGSTRDDGKDTSSLKKAESETSVVAQNIVIPQPHGETNEGNPSMRKQMVMKGTDTL